MVSVCHSGACNFAFSVYVCVWLRINFIIDRVLYFCAENKRQQQWSLLSLLLFPCKRFCGCVFILSAHVTVQGLEGQLLLLRIACSANSHARHVVLRRQHDTSRLWPPFDMTLASLDNGNVSCAFITRIDISARHFGLHTGDQVRLCLMHYSCQITKSLLVCVCANIVT